MKDVDIENRRLVDMLMDHREERMEDAESYIEPYRNIVIRRLMEHFGFDNEEEIVKVIGYFDVNSIAVRGK